MIILGKGNLLKLTSFFNYMVKKDVSWLIWLMRHASCWNLSRCLCFPIWYPHVTLVHVVRDRNDRPVNFCQNIIYPDVTMIRSKRMLWDFDHISVYSNLIVALYHNKMYTAPLISLCLQARQPGGADLFICYAGVQMREPVAAEADWVVFDFQELITKLP